MIIIRRITVFTLLFLILSYGFSQETVPEEPTAQETDKLLFTINGVITSASEVIQTGFRKGLSVFIPVKANQRYAALVLSKNLDTALRLDINSKETFKDLFLGENAGILFTPSEQDIPLAVEQEGTQANKNINNSNNTETTAVITALAADFSNDDSDVQKTSLGEYTMSVYTVVSPQIIDVETDLKAQTLNPEDTIVGRVTKEYALELEENKRIYIYMNSNNFDTLLEFSDRYGNTVVSDDWIQSDTQDFASSLVTVVMPKTDVYFINTSSFNGNATGNFDLEMEISDNVLQLSQNDKITVENTKIFEKYVKEYPLSLGPQEMRTIEIIALSGNMEILFTNAQRGSLYKREVKEGQTIVFPVRALEEGEYKIIISHEELTPASYSIKIYQ